MASDHPKGRVQARPGAALKELRAQRGLTLADVSYLTGMNVSTLSKIENGKVALTLEKLMRISDGLGVDMTELISPTSKEAPKVQGATRRSVSRAGEGQAIEMAKGNSLYLAAELLNKRITPIVGEVFAKSIDEYEELMRHAGEEFVYVLEGTLELHLEMYTPVRLDKGDSVYFDSEMGHAYIAVGVEPCRILSICATTDAHLTEATAFVADANHTSVIKAPAKQKANG